MGKAEIEAFLSHLAVEEQVAASTQNQALSALLFLYRYVLNQPFEEPLDALRAKRSRYLPTVLFIRVIIGSKKYLFVILTTQSFPASQYRSEGRTLIGAESSPEVESTQEDADRLCPQPQSKSM